MLTNFFIEVVSTYFLFRFRQVSEQIFLHEEGAMRASLLMNEGKSAGKMAEN